MSLVCKSSYFSADWVLGGLQNKVATFSLIWQFCVWIAWKLYFPEKHEATFRLQFLLLPFYSLTSFSGFFKTSVQRFPNPRLLFFTLIFMFFVSFPPFGNLISSSLYMHLSRHVTSWKESNMFTIFIRNNTIFIHSFLMFSSNVFFFIFFLYIIYIISFISALFPVPINYQNAYTQIEFSLSFSITNDMVIKVDCQRNHLCSL